MPAINFKKEFAEMVEKGTKRQTIREDIPHWRKVKAGDKLFLFTGLRTKYCRRLFYPKMNETKYTPPLPYVKWMDTTGIPTPISLYAYVECTGVEPIIITEEHAYPYRLDIDLAEKDGFKSVPEMKNFFRKHYGLPFKGLIIKW